MDPRIVAFLRRLHELRIERGITQAQLAERSGLSQQTISRLDSEAFDVQISTLLKLTDALGIATDTLFPQPNDQAR
jgi:transcriptional regulator with XRE-family HTH domain